VVVYAMSAWSDGDGDGGGATVLKIKAGERGSWPLGSVRLIDGPEAGKRGSAILELAGERIAVWWDPDPSTDELVALLSR
jgi:hypothetical protein